MSEDKKKVTEEVVEEIVVEENLNEEDLDKASGGSEHMHGYVVGKDGRVYPPCPD